MNYYQIKVPLPNSQEQTEILIALLAEAGCDSFEEQTEQLIAFIPEKEFSKNSILQVDYMASCDNNNVLEVELIPDKNWNEVWESNYPSVTIANRCYVRAPFHDPNPRVDYEIVIKPKMAFGTAHHETTAMMLEMILDGDFSNKNVLDMGCGSGVLAIMASMKGAQSVVAIDTDHWSYDNTMENTLNNNIGNVEVQHGGAELLLNQGKFDIILANINKNILLRDMKYYTDSLVDGGFIYFSGYYANDLSDIESEASSFGLKLVDSLEKNMWIAAKFIKNI